MPDAWDERTLGHDERYVKRATASEERRLDQALGIKRKLDIYLFEYEYAGDKYSLAVAAYSEREAIGRTRRMSTAIYNGMLIATIPAAMSWPARAVITLRNWFFRP